MTAKAQPAKGNTLVYENRKQDPMKWDISTPELRAKAFLELFTFLRQTWRVYACDFWGKNKAEEEFQKALFASACEGDAEAAEKLLTMRIDYEYEEWQILDAPVVEPGEPKKVLAKKPSSVYVKDIRRQSDSGRYSFQLSNGEEIEMAYIPVNTTRQDWQNGWLIHHFLIDSFYEKLGRQRDYEKNVEEMLSLINYMRLTLYYTMFPERMPVGKSLPVWQRRSLSSSESLIDRHGANPVEKLPERKVRPTDLQQAQNIISELVRTHEGLLQHIGRIVSGEGTIKELKHYVLPSHTDALKEIKKRMNIEGV